ncbi:lysylphosphatidylglycerol synthase domain-containing protein [Micromonospora sp. WMMA1998]|uniref:lysylphosphatidylglycerol synthase domain-containing protein n=1 Tax=Micromonospora sp. WMMA1998 TaxID=3015167 RepID=UPI00248D295D|nr:lysylphosphatidylglycerol synthase domain-containing protein [Micromonospora sp. WMMA1998]WBC14832.1 lysylphosphatidylglycerol synthase domain-containing protein [Micromonospora sp. WMMA1998]
MKRGQLASGVRAIVYAVVLGVIGWQLWSRRSDLVAGVAAVGAARCLLATALALAGLWLGMLGWHTLLAGVGVPVALRPATRLYFVSGLAKYLPGGLWPAVAQADLARSLNLPATRLAVTFLGSVVVSVLAGLAVGLPALLPLVGAAIPVSVLVATGALAALLATVVHRRRQRFGLAIPGRSMLVAFALTAAGWMITGLHVVVLAGALGVPARSAPLLIGAFALATVAGMVAVVLPAGIGARDGVLLAMLVGVVGPAGGLTVVVLSRALMTCADVVAAGVAVLAARQLLPVEPAQRR